MVSPGDRDRVSPRGMIVKDKPDRDGTFLAAVGEIANSNITEKDKQRALQALAAQYLDGKETIVKPGSRVGNVVVPPRTVGVVRDGGVGRGVYGPGRTVGLPGWTTVEGYPTGLQRKDFETTTYSKRRLKTTLKLTVQFIVPASVAGKITDLCAPDKVYSDLIEPRINQRIREITATKSEEDMMNPAFALELTRQIQADLDETGVQVQITIKDSDFSPVLVTYFEDLANAELQVGLASARADVEVAKLQAEMRVFQLRAKLQLMGLGIRLKIRFGEGVVEALVEQIMGQIRNDLERERRQSDFFSEDYFRELLIKQGGWGIFAEHIGEAAETLASAFGQWIEQKARR